MTMNRVLMAVPSNIPVVQANIGRNITIGTGASKSKEIVIPYPGTYRIKFSLTQSGASSNSSCNGRIQRNAVDGGADETHVGMLHTCRAGVNEFVASTFVEDIGGWKKGDLCQLWVGSTNVASTVSTVLGFGIFAEYGWVPPPIPEGVISADASV